MMEYLYLKRNWQPAYRHLSGNNCHSRHDSYNHHQTISQQCKANTATRPTAGQCLDYELVKVTNVH